MEILKILSFFSMDLNDERYEAFYEGDETDEDAD